uniref:G-protein coupled receptors family 1 profile domain-containing protein n=1 Tax=Gopherus agassizii TaxID=38772 RepID=A0A452I908_9SAUR
IFLFVVLLMTYLLSVMGNVVIISLIWTNYLPHTPMYFFLSNLSFLDILFRTVIASKMLSNLPVERESISFTGCITQTYFYFFPGTVDFILQALMSFDWHVAICNPLWFKVIMNSRACFLMVFGVPSSLPCCSHSLNHFFRDIAAFLQVACVETHVIKLIDFLLSSLVVLSSLVLTAVSYGYTISTILRIPLGQGRQKAFSTHISHITVVTSACRSSIFMYFCPNQSCSLDFDKVAAVLRSKVKEVLKDTVSRTLFSKGTK